MRRRDETRHGRSDSIFSADSDASTELAETPTILVYIRASLDSRSQTASKNYTHDPPLRAHRQRQARAHCQRQARAHPRP